MQFLKKAALLLGLFSAFFALAFLSACEVETKKTAEKTAEKATEKMPEKTLRHVVLFKFKDGTSPADIEKVETAFRNLPNEIKEIKGFEFGLNNSPENLNAGFTHCFFLTFSSEADRAIYLPHPSHKAFGALLTPFLDKVLVVDYWVK